VRRIYKKKQYVIYETKSSGFIVQNILMDGFAHTHLENFATAKRVVGLSLAKKVPQNLSFYVLISLKRVNTDEKYLEKINQVLENHQKKQRYVNQQQQNLTNKRK